MNSNGAGRVCQIVGQKLLLCGRIPMVQIAELGFYKLLYLTGARKNKLNFKRHAVQIDNTVKL
jgi:hypothetical protein